MERSSSCEDARARRSSLLRHTSRFAITVDAVAVVVVAVVAAARCCCCRAQASARPELAPSSTAGRKKLRSRSPSQRQRLAVASERARAHIFLRSASERALKRATDLVERERARSAWRRLIRARAFRPSSQCRWTVGERGERANDGGERRRRLCDANVRIGFWL